MLKIKPLTRTLLYNYDFKYKSLPPNICIKKTHYTVKPFEGSITHCIFDVDGTLLNTATLYPKVLSQLCESFGKHFPGKTQPRLLDEPQRKIMETIIKELKLTISVTVLEHRFAQMIKTKLPSAPVQESALELVNHLDINKIPMACVSNQTKKTLEGLLRDKPYLFGKFHHIVCLDDVNNRGKPEPDLYLRAANLFPRKPEPGRCLVFESSELGVRGANAANMKVVLATPGYVNEEVYKTAKDTLFLSTLKEFDPEQYGLPPYNTKPTSPTTPEPNRLRTLQNELTYSKRYSKW